MGFRRFKQPMTNGCQDQVGYVQHGNMKPLNPVTPETLETNYEHVLPEMSLKVKYAVCIIIILIVFIQISQFFFTSLG